MENMLTSKLFKVRIPVMYTYTQFELEVMGTRVNSRDNEHYNTNEQISDMSNLVTVMINLDKILDIYINGGKILICDENDVETIYQTLENYLQTVNRQVTRSLNSKIVKENRIDDIDRFLTEMFGYNRKNILTNVISKSGYELNINLFNSQISNQQHAATVAAYNNQYDNTTYINNNLPDVDIDKVDRLSYRKQSK